MCKLSTREKDLEFQPLSAEMYTGSASYKLAAANNNVAPVVQPELVKDAVLQRQLDEMDGSTGAKIESRPRIIHVSHPMKLGELMANPDAATWRFQANSVALNSLADQDANGVAQGDTRRVLMTSALVNNQGTNFTHSELTYVIHTGNQNQSPMFQNSVANNVDTQTGSIHAAGIPNQPLELMSHADTEADVANLELMTLTPEQIEKCFFSKESPETGEIWYAVHKGTPAAKAVVLKENCKKMMRVLKAEYRQQNGGSLEGWVKPRIYYNYEQSPIITMSNAYYNYALESAKQYAQEQQDKTTKIFSNLDSMEVTFAPAGTTWTNLYNEITQGMDDDMCQRVKNQRFYASFYLNVSYSVMAGAKIKSTDAATTSA